MPRQAGNSALTDSKFSWSCSATRHGSRNIAGVRQRQKRADTICALSTEVSASPARKVTLTVSPALDIFRDLICQEPLAAEERTVCDRMLRPNWPALTGEFRTFPMRRVFGVDHLTQASMS